MTKKTTKQKSVSGGLRVDAYRVLELAVEAGVNHGWRRAYKHSDNPSEDDIKQAMTDNIMSSICEWFAFDPPAES